MKQGVRVTGAIGAFVRTAPSALVFILCFFCFLGAGHAAQYVPGEALVLLKNGVGDIDAASLERSAGDGYIATAAAKAGARVVKTYGALSEQAGDIFMHVKSDTKSTDDLIAELKKNPDVICASPNYIMRVDQRPNDFHRLLWGPRRIGAEDAWDVSTGAPDVFVAVMDTGIQRDHPDLVRNIDFTRSRNFIASGDVISADDYGDREGHGTHVSGTIGAVGNNGIGITGINWNVKIITLRVGDDDGAIHGSAEIGAISYLIDMLTKNPGMNLPVVNMSYGGWRHRTPEEALDEDVMWWVFKQLDSLNRTVIVTSAGNNALEVGAPAQVQLIGDGGIPITEKGDYAYPQSYIGLNNMIVVGSTEEGDSASIFTNWSSRYVHLAAPGGEIYSTYIFEEGNDEIIKAGGTYATNSGTSMAAPHVSGAVALLASKRPDWTAAQLKSHLLRHADKTTNPVAPALNLNDGTDIIPQNVADATVSRHGLLDMKRYLRTSFEDVKVNTVEVRAVKRMDVGVTYRVAAHVLPDGAIDKRVSWKSSDSTVLAVTTDGYATAHKRGTAILTATALDGSGTVGNMAVNVVMDGDEEKAPESSGSGCSAGFAGAERAWLTLFAFAAAGLLSARRLYRKG